MKFAVVFLAVCAIAFAASVQRDTVVTARVSPVVLFKAFMDKHNKVYATPQEEIHRFAIFQENLKVIEERNAAEPHGNPHGVTKFSDMTQEEFEKTMLMPKRKAVKSTIGVDADLSKMNQDLPTSVDWREKGAITPVKNQAQCGSCWAFSATEGVESGYFLAGNTLTKLSVQQTVSCDDVDQGCNGGDLPSAWSYMMKAGGIETEEEYPYTSGGGNTGRCKVDSSKEIAKPTSIEWATRSGNETAMAVALANDSPLSICVDASNWNSYSGGIVKKNCGKQLDHCVQAVGYNVQGSIEYFIIKNSWASDWGEQGYIYVEKNNRDLCGIAEEAGYVKAEKV